MGKFAIHLLMLVVVSTLSPAAYAAQIAITCPSEGPTLELKLKLDGDRMEVTDANSTASVAARLESDPSGLFAISATGPVVTAMPAPDSLDRCISSKLKQQNEDASASDVVIFLTNQCRLALSSSAVRQSVTANYTITSLETGQASLLISHQYLTPSSVTKQPIKLDEWPMRNCDVIVTKMP